MATYQRDSQKVVRRRIIFALMASGLLLLAGLAWLFVWNIQVERSLTTTEEPPVISDAEDTVFVERTTPIFDSAEEPTVELEEINDNQRRENIDAIHSALQAYFAEHDSYPTLTNMNSDQFRLQMFPQLDNDDFRDPDDSSSQIAITRTAQPAVYAYDVVNENGFTCEPHDRVCTSYTLLAQLSDGTVYSVTSD